MIQFAVGAIATLADRAKTMRRRFGVIVLLVGCVGCASSGGEARRLPVAGRTLWEFEGLLRQSFPQGRVSAFHRTDFNCAGDGCGPLSDYGPYAFVFARHTDSTFHLSTKDVADGTLGNYPLLLRINGKPIACDADEERFLIVYASATNFHPDCLPPLPSAAPPAPTSAPGGPRAMFSPLSSVNWSKATVHTELCGGTGTETLEGGVGFTLSSKWEPSIVQISLGAPVVYGDVDGDGAQEAVVPLWCTNGGGTAAGQLGFGLEVFSGTASDMTLLGTITPEPPLGPHHTSYIDTAETRIGQGSVTVQELFYGPSDGTCCPSGRRESVWTFDNGALRRASLVVITEAK